MHEKTQRGLGTETLADAGDTLFPGSTDGSPNSGTLLSNAPAVGAESAPEGAPARGDSIGRFVVLGVLGSGGMGLVYSAYDPHLDRKVAIKLLHHSSASRVAADGRTRLLREAQAMAKINHPNVIKVHEVGMFADQVYVAMEFAEAGTLRSWLGAHKRTPREILDVLVQAGRGLAAAHAVGLIHRDFKPDNVLMSADGGVRVTDFGLVSVIRPQEDGPTTVDSSAATAIALSISNSTPLSQDLTRTGSVMGTPSYMSPEQFNGAIATSRSDQFAFCVTLYEALYGERPFRGSTFPELAENVTAGNLLPPPKHAEVPSWLRRVLLRGLSTATSDRFASMEALLSELGRDRTRRRQRVAAWSALAVVAASGIAYAVLPARAATCRVDSERLDKVWSAARRAQMKTAFLASQRPFAQASFTQVAKLVDDWVATWQLAYTDACEDTRVRGEQSEHLLDLRMECLSRRLDETGATIDLLAAGGIETVDHAIDAALRLPAIAACADVSALIAAVPPPETPGARSKVDAIRSKLDAARAQDRLGRYAPARDIAQAAVADARVAGYAPLISEALLVLGIEQIQLADRAGIDNEREAMHVAAQAGDQTVETGAAAWLVYALATQTEHYDIALEIAEMADAVATHAHPQPEAIVRLDNARGLLDAARGKNADAQARFERALARAEKEVGPETPATITSLNQLGNLLKTEGKFAEARTTLERALAIDEKVFGKDHPDVAIALHNLGNVYRAEGKLDDAKRLYDRALAIRIAALGPDHPEVGTSYNGLGNFYADQEDQVTAQKYYEKALAIWSKFYGPESLEAASIYANVGLSLSGQGKLDDARSQLEHALHIYETVKGSDDPSVATTLSNLGTVVQHQHDLDAALTMFQRAEAIATKAYGPSHPDVADYLLNEATVLKGQHKLPEAQTATEHAIEVVRKAYGPDHPRMAMGLTNLANIQEARDDYKGALASYQASLAIFEKRFGKDHPYVSYPALGVGTALVDLKRASEAMPYLERALALRTKAKMGPVLVAEVQFELGAALVGSSATHARGIAEANAALAGYIEAKDTENIQNMRQWLAKHR